MTTLDGRREYHGKEAGANFAKSLAQFTSMLALLYTISQLGRAAVRKVFSEADNMVSRRLIRSIHCNASGDGNAAETEALLRHYHRSSPTIARLSARGMDGTDSACSRVI